MENFNNFYQELEIKETYSMFNFEDNENKENEFMFSDNIEQLRFEDNWESELDFSHLERFSVPIVEPLKPNDCMSSNIETHLENSNNVNYETSNAIYESLEEDAPVSIKIDQKPKLEKKDKEKACVSLAERKDVVNRSILRGIKKYFLCAFLESFPEYKNKRICRVHKPTLLNDVKVFCGKNDDQDYLVKAVFCMIRPNSIDFVSESDCFTNEVNAFINCIQKYAHNKLESVTRGRFAKVLFEYIFEDSVKTKEFLDMNPLMHKHPEAYKSGIERFIECVHN